MKASYTVPLTIEGLITVLSFGLPALVSDTPSGVTIITRHRNSRPGLQTKAAIL